MPPRESWRDVAAAYLVHRGLRLASPRARRGMALHLAADLYAEVARHRETLAEVRGQLGGEVREVG